MKLIADSGATKTHWLLIHDNQHKQLVHTMGINPFHQPDKLIARIIAEELAGTIDKYKDVVQEIFFYGAGCVPETRDTVLYALRDNFAHAKINIESDLLGAARALCQHTEGIACILGTGSNSCLYDGENIVDNVPPLGYILGDEGGGAYLGKRFIGDCLKRQIPEDICQGFLSEYQLTLTDILKRVYRGEMGNRFLANVAPYIYKVKDRPEIHLLLLDCFNQFFIRNVQPYDHQLPVSFAGSIAWYFKEEVEAAASHNGYTVSTFLKDPIEGLAEYYK